MLITNDRANPLETRPVVNIFFAGEIETALANQLCLGLEEEGIPWECRQENKDRVIDLAKKAADLSKLNVGIGIDSKKKRIVLHHRDLPKEKPLFLLAAKEVDLGELRRLGTNAARLVKGDPLLLTVPTVDPSPLHDGPRSCRSMDQNDIDIPHEQLDELVTRVLEALENYKT